MPDQGVQLRNIEQRTQQAAIAHLQLERFDEPLADIDEMRLEPAQHHGVKPVDRDTARPWSVRCRRNGRVLSDTRLDHTLSWRFAYAKIKQGFILA